MELTVDGIKYTFDSKEHLEAALSKSNLTSTGHALLRYAIYAVNTQDGIVLKDRRGFS